LPSMFREEGLSIHHCTRRAWRPGLVSLVKTI
jgi:hypothetical protein